MHRVLSPFDFLEPTSVDEAASLVDGRSAVLLAGGVDLVLKMRLRQVQPDTVVSLQKVPGLDYIEVDQSGLRFGALATLHALERSEAVRRDWTLLADAIGSIVSIQTKVMGTAIGNLCVGTPASDVAPALCALGARLRIAGPGSARDVPVDDFFLDVGRTAVEPHEIVTEAIVPRPAEGSRGVFLKLGKTAEDIAKVNVAVLVTVAGGVCLEARIALGSVAPTLVRSRQAERALVGRPLDAGSIDEAAQAASAETAPISDVRTTAGYRREMVRVLVGDALRRAAAPAGA